MNGGGPEIRKSWLDELFFRSVNYLTLLDRFLNDAAESRADGRHLGNVGYTDSCRPIEHGEASGEVRMRAPVISGGTPATGFSSALQWFRQRFHFISGALVLCAAMLGSGAYQSCQSATTYRYTGNQFDPSRVGSRRGPGFE